MKRLRYSPAASPGRGRPLSKNTLQRRYEQAAQAASALTVQTAALTRKLQAKEAEAHNVNLKLRQLFRTSADRADFGGGGNIIRASIDIDTSMHYRDVGVLLTEAVVELVAKLLRAAPELHVGLTADLLKRVKQTPREARDHKIWQLYQAIIRDLYSGSFTDPESDELVKTLRYHLHAHAFGKLLNLATDHAHLLGNQQSQDAAWPGSR